MSNSVASEATISISGIEVFARIGAGDAERTLPQRLRLDCTFCYDASAAVRNDRLAEAVDYAAVAETLRSVLAGRTRRLLETAAVECADAVLAAYPAIRSLCVTISKPGVPEGADQTGVSLARVRQSTSSASGGS